LLPDPSKEQNWSGRGEHAEFKPNETAEISKILEPAEILGISKTAVVQKVRCRRILLARKTIHCHRKFPRADALKEVEHLKRLPHAHVVSVIGTYIFKQDLAILLYPAAEYNLQTFMDAISSANEEDEVEKRISFFRLHAIAGFFGCIARTIEFLHRKLIRHMDIKPSNLLVKCVSDGYSLRPGYKIYIADFGITRSYEQLADSETESPTDYTPKYASPEVVDQSKRGFPSDIFSLGCVYVDMLATLANDCSNTKSELLSILKCEYFPKSYHGNIPSVMEWVNELRLKNVQNHFFFLLSPLISHIPDMLDPEPSGRPTALEVTFWLERDEFCCPQSSKPDVLCLEDGVPFEEDNTTVPDMFFDTNTHIFRLSCGLLARLKRVSGLENRMDLKLAKADFNDTTSGGPTTILWRMLKSGEVFRAITQSLRKKILESQHGNVLDDQAQVDVMDSAEHIVTVFLQEAKDRFHEHCPEAFSLNDLFGDDPSGTVKVTSSLCSMHML
jgi:serine/threonine protein kinase